MKPGEETLGEASQMLRDILQNKEKKQKDKGCEGNNNNNNNNNTLNLKSFDADSATILPSPQQPLLGSAFCASADSEMMNSMMRGKSSSSKANSEDNDGQSFHNLSGDESDMDGSYNAGTQSGDDAHTAAHSPPRPKDKDSLNGEEDDAPVSPALDDSVGLCAASASPDSKEAKRARVENILTTIRQSPLQIGGYDGMLGQAVPLEMKRQKRKQPQPQQHDVRSILAPESKYRQVERMVLQEHIRQLHQQLHAAKRSFHQISTSWDSDDDETFNSKDDAVSGRSEDLEGGVRVSPDNFLRVNTSSQREKHCLSPVAHGLSPRGNGHPTRGEDSMLMTSTPLRLSGLVPMSDFSVRRKSRDSFGPLQNGTCIPIFPFPPTNPSLGFQRAAVTLKTEILQAVTKAVDSAVSTVLEKMSESQHEAVKSEAPNQEQRQQQPQQQQPPQQQHQHHQQHQQQDKPREREHQHHQAQLSQKHSEGFQRPSSAPRPPKPEREALKEAVSNSQTGEARGPELVIPYPDHLNFLERFSSSRLPEKISAFEPLHPHHHHGHHRGSGFHESELLRPQTSSALAFPPHFPYAYMHAGLLPPVFPVEPEQTEAMALVVNSAPKKKRTKVTDTRLSPRAKSALLNDSPISVHGMLGPDMPLSMHADLSGGRHPGLPSPFSLHYPPPALPTSVAIANPSLHRSDLFSFRFHHDAMFGCDSHLGGSPPLNDRSSPQSPLNDHSPHSLLRSSADFDSAPDSMDGQNSQKTCTLTPMHLRKAKLMFFYTRYPNSGILKIYFPDVSFNKNNTAQLVKWFSNFREFYYIQMEKYARQAIADGCVHCDELVVNRDSELFRHLNLHYNRNNQIEAPDTFRNVVEATLREFYRAVFGKKDLESSWKKSIYKVIARMDEPIPEFFKSSNWMEQLGDV